METQALDGMASAAAAIAQRTLVSAELDQIAHLAKEALLNAGIDLELFFMVPHSGDAILTFGTISDPDDPLWERVGTAITSVLQEITGLECPRSRPVHCATTGPISTCQHATVAQIESAT